MKKYQPNTNHYRDLLKACRAEIIALGYGRTAAKLNGAGELLSWLEKRGRLRLAEVKRADMQAFVDHLRNRPNARGGALSEPSITAYLYGCKLLLNYAERHGLRGGNPLLGLARTQVQGRERYAAGKTEIKRLYATAKDNGRMTALLHLLYSCGLRGVEVERLDLGDVDYSRSLLYVRQGKGHKRRVIPLTTSVKNDLHSYQRHHRWQWARDDLPNKSFLLDDRGGRMRRLTLARRLRQLVIQAKVNPRITPHVLRHSVATHLMQGGMPLERIRDFLGHDHLETTQIYTHVKEPIL